MLKQKLVLAALIGVAMILVNAQKPVSSSERPTGILNAIGTSTNLEKAFWRCDYLATKSLVDTGTAGTCTPALQQ
jgi:hypothetical protein